ncbi:Uncharacterised protein [Vibrio cholerae]|nr:Uncharacterised protein [Vibrio cholerae]
MANSNHKNDRNAANILHPAYFYAIKRPVKRELELRIE